MTSVVDPSAFTTVSSWGMVQTGRSIVRRPTSVDEVRAALAEARAMGLSVGFRGAGNSYGDAALNDGGFLLDMSGMGKILAFDPEAGTIDAEPGATIADIWQKVIGESYWPPVVPGTMKVSLGGAASMNIHGKNNFAQGTIGKHIESFDFMTADGAVRTVTRESDPDLFFAAIGGLGVLGCFTRFRLHLKRVPSGLMRVEPIAVASFKDTIDAFDRLEKTSDYLVGWHDAFGCGDALGRGLMHRATHLSPGEDPDPRAALSVARQSLPSTFFGIFPKSMLWMGLWFFLNDPGMRCVNLAKLLGGRRHAKKPPYLQPHAAFHFLLDYVPNWKYAYKPGGLFQYQVFVPYAHAARVFAKLVTITQKHDHRPYLLVTKRHRPDPFWLTHAVDGFSMAMDFKITRRNRARFETMAHAMDEIVMDAGGRFYGAKDSVMRPEVFRRVYPAENVARFLELKRRLDPTGLFTSSLYRRVIG